VAVAGTGFGHPEAVNHQYLGQAGASSGQDSSNENQNYNQAQVKQGESASDVKNTGLQRVNNGGQATGPADAPAGGAPQRHQEASNQAQ